MVFFITAVAILVFFFRGSLPAAAADPDRSESRFTKWDRIVVGLFLITAWWMEFGTLNFFGGAIQIGHHEFPDFGSTLSIMQSFAVGHNFPTQLPHFSGEHIRYHFLFYFQAGNLEYLGLNPALSNNLLSVFSLVSMLVLVMTLGFAVFRSKLVGRIGAILFFFHGTLSFFPFLTSQSSLTELWEKLSSLQMFLSSGFPYRGEDWGVSSQVVFLNQRHFASSIGLLLVILIFLAIRYQSFFNSRRSRSVTQGPQAELQTETVLEVGHRPDTNERSSSAEVVSRAAPTELRSPAETEYETETADLEESIGEPETSGPPEPLTETEAGTEAETEAEAEAETEAATEDVSNVPSEPGFESYRSAGSASERSRGRPAKDWKAYIQNLWAEPMGDIIPYVFAGIILGLTPMWNSAVFTAAFAILGLFLILLPLRRQMVVLGIVTAVVAIPQLAYLRGGGTYVDPYPMFHWGYIVEDPTVLKVAWYLLFTFGFKWVFILIAVIFSNSFQRRVFIAVSALLPMTYLIKFSIETLIAHKFINIWLVVINLFVAYGFLRLWQLGHGGARAIWRIAAVIMMILVMLSGAIDLIPIGNSHYIPVRYTDDKLTEWIKANTDPRSIFMSHRYINNPILVAGRRLFYGDPYYAWGAGYDTGLRDRLSKTLFESRDINEVFRIIKENHIDYVAIEDIVRHGNNYNKSSNEDMYAAYFPLVFSDDENQYGNLKIYKVPDELTGPLPGKDALEAPAANAFSGKAGSGPGELMNPRGVAVDKAGNIYVADTGNSRIQKYDATGKLLSTFGEKGDQDGQLREPNGIAVDSSGHVFVSDALNNKIVRFDANGKFVSEWRGPDDGFYGPRDIVFGPNGQLYIVDQGKVRIARLDPATGSYTKVWGTRGDGEGQFNEATAIGIGGDLLYVTDTGNERIQVFDLDGKFVRQWKVPAWQGYSFRYPDVAYDPSSKLLFVTGPGTNDVLVFDAKGGPQPSIKPSGDAALGNPSSIVLSESGKGKRLLVLSTGTSKVSAIDLDK